MAQRPALHGWLIIDKPIGLGSTNVVGAVKRALRDGGYAKVKVGHGGTLDPLASGVLPIALGEATKLAGRMLDASKTYEFTIQFGRQTDTLDVAGTVIAHGDRQPDRGVIEAVLDQHFTGTIDQVPPAYSAIRVDGARAYDRARAGEAVVLSSRRVTVGPWRWIAEATASVGDTCERTVTLGVTVTKGTYIRSLARDIAIAAGTVGHVVALRRTRAGPFGLATAIALDKLREFATASSIETALMPLTAALDGIPALTIAPDQAVSLRQGRVLDGVAAHDGLYLAIAAAMPVALVQADAGCIRVVRGFNL